MKKILSFAMAVMMAANLFAALGTTAFAADENYTTSVRRLIVNGNMDNISEFKLNGNSAETTITQKTVDGNNVLEFKQAPTGKDYGLWFYSHLWDSLGSAGRYGHHIYAKFDAMAAVEGAVYDMFALWDSDGDGTGFGAHTANITDKISRSLGSITSDKWTTIEAPYETTILLGIFAGEENGTNDPWVKNATFYVDNAVAYFLDDAHKIIVPEGVTVDPASYVQAEAMYTMPGDGVKLTVAAEAGETVTVKMNGTTVPAKADGSYIFTMPDSDATITVEKNAVEYKTSVRNLISNGTMDDVSEFKVNNSSEPMISQEVVDGNNVLKFTQPAEGVQNYALWFYSYLWDKVGTGEMERHGHHIYVKFDAMSAVEGKTFNIFTLWDSDGDGTGFGFHNTTEGKNFGTITDTEWKTIVAPYETQVLLGIYAGQWGAPYWVGDAAFYIDNAVAYLLDDAHKIIAPEGVTVDPASYVQAEAMYTMPNDKVKFTAPAEALAVKMNGTALTAEADGSYIFTMPDGDATITVDLPVVEPEYNAPDFSNESGAVWADEVIEDVNVDEYNYVAEFTVDGEDAPIVKAVDFGGIVDAGNVTFTVIVNTVKTVLDLVFKAVSKN